MLLRPGILLLLPALLGWLPAAHAQAVATTDLHWLGERIFRNECNSRPECLTAWNAGEDFPSLGIGHFIWYREGQQEVFAETFPALLAFMRARGAEPPAWIAEHGDRQPWPDRDSFLAATNSASDTRLRELREFLAGHTELQAAFIVDRFGQALERMLAAAPAAEHATLRRRFETIVAAAPPLGLYALVDYIHFKGEGSAPGERYQGQGWGLLQVLQGMQEETLAGFVASARATLATRVALAPPERNEQRWLAGWNRRLDTYLDTTLD